MWEKTEGRLIIQLARTDGGVSSLRGIRIDAARRSRNASSKRDMRGSDRDSCQARIQESSPLILFDLHQAVHRV
jgi:hypothetical protein